MNTAQKGQVVQPGIDHPSVTNNLHSNVASSLSTALGQQIVPDQVAPAASWRPLDNNLAEDPHPETDWDDFYNGAIAGRPRTDPSKNFLKMLLGKLRKKDPQKEVVPEIK